MATKAVHVELCSNLTTEALLAAINRFAARRGLPSDIFSDNGTNLVSASRTLCQRSAGEKGIKWHFIPPRSTHFGGLWESNIKTLKRLITKTMGSVPLRYDELETVLVNAEAMMNSRPLVMAHSTEPDKTATFDARVTVSSEGLLSHYLQNTWRISLSHTLGGGMSSRD